MLETFAVIYIVAGIIIGLFALTDEDIAASYTFDSWLDPLLYLLLWALQGVPFFLIGWFGGKCGCDACRDDDDDDDDIDGDCETEDELTDGA